MSDQLIAAPRPSQESVGDGGGDAVLDLSLRERLRLAFAVVRGNGAPGPHGPHGPHGITYGTHEVEVVPVAEPRPRPSAGALVAVAAVTGVVVLICYVAWAVLAGERLVVGDASGDPGRRELVRDLRAPEPPDSTPRDLSTTTVAPAQTPRGAAPVPGGRSTTIDGSLAALVVAASAIVAGLAVTRVILRRSRRSRGSDDGPVDELELVEAGDGDVTDGEAEADSAPEHHADHDDGDVGSPDDDTEQETDVGPVVPSPHSGGHDAATSPEPEAGATSTAVGRADPRVVLYDRRMTRRMEVSTPARLQWPGHDTACAAESLSIWGLRCLVPTSDPDQVPGVGSSVRITIAVGGALLPLGASVTYTRSGQDGHVVGLRFHPLDEVHRDFLFAVIDDADADGPP